MIKKEEIERFIGLFISIGVPHITREGKLFFYYGYLKSVTDSEVKLETKNGFKLIPLNQIQDIHITKNETTRGRETFDY